MKVEPRILDFSNKKDIITALLYKGAAQKRLFERARQVRDRVFLKKVETRSVIEYSNLCRQACKYCGMSINSKVKRYILEDNEFLNRIDKLYFLGRRVIIIQSGEANKEEHFYRLFKLLKRIIERHADLTLIASFGCLSESKYKKLIAIGIERYLLKFETSDCALYKKIKPSDTFKKRLAHINMLKNLGFNVSSGNITGLPGQTLENLAEDLFLLKSLNLPMGSTSVFIPNEMSDYAGYSAGSIDIALNFTAILRIMCPSMLIPATSSLELIKSGGQYLGLMAGANVVTLHDGTPRKKERKYVIYKKDRYKPGDILFKIVKKANLEVCFTSLIRQELKRALFYKLINRNLGQKKAAVYFEGCKYTYNDLLILTSKFCSFLQENNIKKGQTVLLAVFDSIEFIVVFLSCIRLGLIIVPVNPELNKDEWDYILSDFSNYRILVTESVLKGLRNKKVLKIADDDSSEYFFSLIKNQPESAEFAGIDGRNTALILYTSGTSGKPKGVIHTYKDLLVDNFPRGILKITDKERVFSCSRIFTSFGLGNSLLFPFHFGASVILTRKVPNPFSFQRIMQFNPAIIFAVPSMYELLLNHSDTLKNCFQKVRLFVASGEKLSNDVSIRWKSVYGKNLLECFGSSEMCHPFISNIPGKQKQGSCGKVVEGFRIKFAQNGQIFCSGASLSVGYLNDKSLTKQKFIDGWFKSDDIGYKDKLGYVFIKGRNNFVFKLNGKWIAAFALEDKLRKCPLIKEIVVTSEQNRIVYYLTLKNILEKKDAERKIRGYCVKNLKIHEFPKTIIILKQMPRTANGKIDRKYFKNN